MVLEVPGDCIRFGVKSSDFAGHLVLSRTKFQQPSRLQKVTTPKPLIVSRCVSNHWKYEKLLYIFSVEIQVRFWLQGHQNLNFVNDVQS
jgi:hypothetical protein